MDGNQLQQADNQQLQHLQPVNTSLVIDPAAEIFFNDALFNKVNQMAEIMASGKCTVPAHLKGNAGDCFAIISQAVQWRMNPFMVAQKTHIVSGTLGYEAQLINAVVTENAPVKGQFHYEFFGPWENVIGKFQWKNGKNGNKYQVPGWTPEDEKGCGVIIRNTLKGEDEPTELKLLLSQATVRNSTLWAADPQQQLGYLAVKRWARRYCPGAIMGVYSPDELEDGAKEVKNITPTKEEPKTQTEKLSDFLNSDDQTAPIDTDAKPAQEQPKTVITIDDLVKTIGYPKENIVGFFITRGTIKSKLSELNNEHRQWAMNNVETLRTKIAEYNNTKDTAPIDTINQKQVTRLFTILGNSGKPEDYLRHYLKEVHGIESIKDIQAGPQYDQIIEWIKDAPLPDEEPQKDLNF